MSDVIDPDNTRNLLPTMFLDIEGLKARQGGDTVIREYQSSQRHRMLCASMLNHCLTNRMLYVMTTARGLEALTGIDPNLTSFTVNGSVYGAMAHHLKANRYFTCVDKGSIGSASLWKLTDRMIKVFQFTEEEKRESEFVKDIQYRKKKNNKPVVPGFKKD